VLTILGASGHTHLFGVLQVFEELQGRLDPREEVACLLFQGSGETKGPWDTRAQLAKKVCDRWLRRGGSAKAWQRVRSAEQGQMSAEQNWNPDSCHTCYALSLGTCLVRHLGNVSRIGHFLSMGHLTTE
jgi:hypothetical protein